MCILLKNIKKKLFTLFWFIIHSFYFIKAFFNTRIIQIVYLVSNAQKTKIILPVLENSLYTDNELEDEALVEEW